MTLRTPPRMRSPIRQQDPADHSLPLQRNNSSTRREPRNQPPATPWPSDQLFQGFSPALLTPETFRAHSQVLVEDLPDDPETQSPWPQQMANAASLTLETPAPVLNPKRTTSSSAPELLPLNEVAAASLNVKRTIAANNRALDLQTLLKERTLAKGQLWYSERSLLKEINLDRPSRRRVLTLLKESQEKQTTLDRLINEVRQLPNRPVKEKDEAWEAEVRLRTKSVMDEVGMFLEMVGGAASGTDSDPEDIPPANRKAVSKKSLTQYSNSTVSKRPSTFLLTEESVT